MPATKVLGQLTYKFPNAHELTATALAVGLMHNGDLAQPLSLHMVAGSIMPAAHKLKLLSLSLLSVLQVGCICNSQVDQKFMPAVYATLG